MIRPELYDAFIEAWDDHIQASIDNAYPAEVRDGLEIDPELRAHFSRAYEILEQIGRKTPPSHEIDQVRAASGFALLLAPSGDIVAASRAAANAPPLQDDLLAGSAELLGQIQRAAQAGDGNAAQVVLSSARAPRHLTARLTPATGPDGVTRLHVAIEALEYRWSAQAETMLVTSFGLSRAEVDIVRNLLAGNSLREIAEHSGRSEHTVRNQAKAVLAKTGAPGQVDLIRLAVFLINQLDAESTRSTSTVSLPQERMQMASGLSMQVIRMGRPRPRAVIFVHGMLDGMAPLNFLAEDFRRGKMQVIAPVRPGFGQSAPVARAEQAMDIYAEHVSELITRERLDRPALLGHLGGGMFAHALASRLGDRVAGLVAASGTAPITRLSQLSHMAPRQRVVAYTARFAPALLPTVLRAGISQIDTLGVEAFVAALFRPGTQESEVIRRLGIAEHLYAGIRFSVEQGQAGFATDSHFVVRDWSEHIARPPVRAIYLKGEHDPVVPAANVVAAMQGRENVEVRLFPDAGQLLTYERAADVFAALDEVFTAAGL